VPFGDAHAERGYALSGRPPNRRAHRVARRRIAHIRRSRARHAGAARDRRPDLRRSRLTGHADAGFTLRVYARTAGTTLRSSRTCSLAPWRRRWEADHPGQVSGQVHASAGVASWRFPEQPLRIAEPFVAGWQSESLRAGPLPCRRSWVRIPSSALRNLTCADRCELTQLGHANARFEQRSSWHGFEPAQTY
jgi:hypothetical protein